MDRILVALSGGVDSSVAAALLVGEGHDVIGVSLQLADASRGGEVSRCCSAADLRDARLVAGTLGIPYYVLNEEEAFSREVLTPFIRAYERGRTPNPCVRCNSVLKFGALARIARALGASRVATGHYARIKETGGVPRITRGADRAKDQSYFLFDLDEEQRRLALFPLGEKTKAEVYDLSVRMSLPVARKPESQDLCFIPEGDVRGYLGSRIGPGRHGEIVNRDGQILGRHGGIHEFTVGQRRGIRVASSGRLYVISLDADRARVVVGGAEDQLASSLLASGCRLHDADLWSAPFRAEARIRSRHEGVPATVTPLGGASDGRLRVRFDAPQRAVTPGQAVVLYDGDLVLGGGWIEATPLDSGREAPVGFACTSSERA